MAFPDAVLPHDIEDAVPDGVPVAAAAGQPRQRHARKLPRQSIAAAPCLQADTRQADTCLASHRQSSVTAV